VNRTLPRGDQRYRSPDSGGPSQSARAVPRVGGLVGGTAVDRRLARADALNIVQHGGFERGRTNPAFLETVAPLETLCASSVRMEEIFGQCY
jgi:hypothetical protein